jgi:hypothetical protein
MVGCHLISQYVSKPLPGHFALLLEILGYLHATRTCVMVFVDPSREGTSLCDGQDADAGQGLSRKVVQLVF